MERRIYHELYHLEKHYWWHVAKRQMVRRFLAGRYSRGRVLDAGCGTGILLRELAEDGFDTFGVDISPLALSFCRKRGDKNLRRGDLQKRLPYRANYFDAMTALDVVEHLGDDLAAVKEFHRILKASGHIYITVPAFQFLWTTHDDLLWHKRRYTREQLTKLLKKAGFSIKRISYFHSFLFPLAFALYKSRIMFNKSKGGTSVVPPKIVNKIMIMICAVEAKVIKKWPLPFGLSIFAEAQKKP